MVAIVSGVAVEITPQTIQQARQWYADNAHACIEGAKSGKYRVNDLTRYIEQQERRAAESLSGAGDNTLAFVQMALYLQTGQSVPLLS